MYFFGILIRMRKIYLEDFPKRQKFLNIKFILKKFKQFLKSINFVCQKIENYAES